MSNNAKTKGNKERANAIWSRDDEATLVRALKQAKVDSLWGDNNPKEAAWTACVVALSGSEKVSGGGPKDDKVLKRRWQRVSTHHTLHYMRIYHTFFS
jgi:hypothetical protein